MRFVARASLVCLLLVAGVASARAGGSDWEGRKLADLPTNFIVGYGTLINTASRNGTAAKPIPAIPVRVLAAFGYTRCWNMRRQSFGFTALGLRKAKPGKGITINGVLYPAEGGDMTKFDQREQGYVRVEVPKSQIEAVGWQRLPQTGHFWIYVPASPGGGGPGQGLSEPAARYPILQSYVDVVVEGGLEYGPDFAREIVETTDCWSRYWLNDRELAHRPWVQDPKARAVDEVLAKASTTRSLLAARAFAETYGAIQHDGAAK
jgi:hypothetical protein